MKQFIKLITLIITSNILAQNNVTITGEVKNRINDSIGIIINDRYNPTDSKTYNSKIDSKGKFRIVIPISISSVAFLKTSKTNIGLFITPNDSIYCTYNDDDVLKSIKFEGNNSSHYNYFIKYLNDFDTPHGYFFKTDYSDVFNMNPSEFKKYRQEKVEKDLLFLKDYSKNHLLTDEFKLFAEVEIKYSYYYGLLSYSSFKEYFKKIEEKLPTDFYSEINSDLFKNDKYLNSDNYTLATKMYVSQLNVGTYTTPELFFPKAMSVSSKILLGKTLFNYQLSTLLEMLQTDASRTLKDSLISSFLEKCPYNEYNTIITNNYKKSKTAHNKSIPQNALKSTFETSNGEKTTFENILKKYKNKVLYIDVWASWCGPCKVEMPSSMSLKNKFKNEDIVFIYMSIDQNKEAWKKAIDNWKINGVHYLLDDGIKSNFSKYFNIIGIPHYILIDKNGKTIFPSAVRPSSKGIESSIRTLL